MAFNSQVPDPVISGPFFPALQILILYNLLKYICSVFPQTNCLPRPMQPGTSFTNNNTHLYYQCIILSQHASNTLLARERTRSPTQLTRPLTHITWVTFTHIANPLTQLILHPHRSPGYIPCSPSSSAYSPTYCS